LTIMETDQSDMDEMRTLAGRFVAHGWGLKRAGEVWMGALIQAALKQSRAGKRAQNQCKAAAALGVHRNTLARRRL
jgi:hypothetical protein